ncbi:MAG: ABC transporter substrate-binding protein [Deltaproteobacteria bacterium]|nr:ABC transporter substrate-binding protein [Deltaproteobacteria bacterium]
MTNPVSIFLKARAIFAFLTMVCISIASPGWTGNLEVAVSRPPVSLDPHKIADPAAWAYLLPCYHRLVAYKEQTTEPVPSLAATWRISDDGRLYTFVLKEGLTFSDGRPVDAEAVRWSFERLLNKNQAILPCGSVLSGFQVMGPNTIRFILRQPCAEFIHALASPNSSIVSPGLADRPPDYLDRHTLGSGQYMIKEWLPDQPVTMETRPDLVGRPRIDRATFYFESDPRNLMKMFCQGQIQMTSGFPSDIWELLKDEYQFTMATVPTFTSCLLVLNVRRPWLSHPEVRQSLSLAIDYQGLIDQVKNGAAQRMFGPLPMGMAGRDADLRRFNYQPDAAREILAKAERPKGPITLIWAQGPADQPLIAKMIQANLQAVGISLQLRPLSDKQFKEALAGGNFDFALSNWRSESAAPEYVLTHFFGSPETATETNPAYYIDPEVDRLLAEANAIADKKKRTPITQKIQKIVVEACPYIYLFQPHLQVWFHRSVHGFEPNPIWPEAVPLETMYIK